MKIVFFGSSDFSLEPLKALTDSKHPLAGVVTVPPAKKGRGQIVQKTEVHRWAEEKGLPVWFPEKLRSEEFLKEIRTVAPDIFVVCSYGKILPQVVLDIPSRLALNVHPSLLPKYRGAAPINWQLIHGEKYGGLTLFRMDAGMDSGDIVWQERYPIDIHETAETLGAWLSKRSAEVLPEILDRIEAGKATFTPQDHSKMTLAPKLSKTDAKLEWSASAEELHNRVRGLLPWPCAYTYFRGETVRILRTVIARSSDRGDEAISVRSEIASPPAGARNDDAQPGQIVSVEKDGALGVATGSGVLLIYEVQRENKNAVSGREFANGVRLKPEDFFK